MVSKSLIHTFIASKLTRKRAQSTKIGRQEEHDSSVTTLDPKREM